MDGHKDSYMYAPPGPGLLKNRPPTSLLSSNIRGTARVRQMFRQITSQTMLLNQNEQSIENNEDALKRVEDGLEEDSQSSFSRNGRF
jgi:hypothetical protein